MDVAALAQSERNELTELCRLYNDKVAEKLAACGGDVRHLVYEAVDLDLAQILVQVLPVLLSLFTGGFSLPIILGLAKTLVGLLVKDQDLANVILQIIEVLIKILPVK